MLRACWPWPWRGPPSRGLFSLSPLGCVHHSPLCPHKTPHVSRSHHHYFRCSLKEDQLPGLHHRHCQTTLIRPPHQPHRLLVLPVQLPGSSYQVYPPMPSEPRQNQTPLCQILLNVPVRPAWLLQSETCQNSSSVSVDRSQYKPTHPVILQPPIPVAAAGTVKFYPSQR